MAELSVNIQTTLGCPSQNEDFIQEVNVSLDPVRSVEYDDGEFIIYFGDHKTGNVLIISEEEIHEILLAKEEIEE